MRPSRRSQDIPPRLPRGPQRAVRSLITVPLLLAGAAAAAAPGQLPEVERDIAVTLSHAAVAPGEPITATFRGIPHPSATDWISIYRAGDPNQSYGEWYYLNRSSSGAVTFKAPSAPGTYDVRLFLNWPRGQYVDVARSAPVVVVRAPTVDLTGVWTGDDGTSCRALQDGDELWWICEQARAGLPTVVGVGPVKGKTARLRTVEVPRAPAATVQVERDPARRPAESTLVLQHEPPDTLRGADPGVPGRPPRSWRRGR